MSTPPPPVQPGVVLAGKYRVEKVLGAGGMGVVVAAEHLQLGQKVALKFLLPESLVNAQAVARFDREARAAAQLKSEHVARVSDVGRLESDAPYIVMELLSGKDLADHLAEHGTLPESEAVDYVLQACEAIAEAHGLGIVHRDLKPRNLFITQGVDGSPLIKVLDFGISKTKNDELALTGTAEVIGSPNYMSPEQLRASRDVDARSDIWSVGAILYEMLGGSVPFVAETLTQLCSMVIAEAPRPLEDLRPDIHRELRRVVEKCLEKDPALRFADVGELALALAPFASEKGAQLATKVTLVAGSRKAAQGTSPPERSSPRVVAGQSTSVSWGATELATTGRRRPRQIALIAGGFVGVIAISATAAFFVTSSTNAPAPAANPPAETPMAPAASNTGNNTARIDVGEAAEIQGALARPEASSPTPAPDAIAARPPAQEPSTKPAQPAVKRSPSKSPAVKRKPGENDDLPMERK